MKSMTNEADEILMGLSAFNYRKLALMALLPVVAMVAGCGGAGKDQVQLLRSEVFGIKQDQRQMQHQLTALDSLIRQRVEGLDRFNAEFGADVGELSRRLSVLEQQLSDTEGRISRLSVRSVAPVQGQSGQQTAREVQAKGPGQRELYDLAYKDYTSSNYQLAVEGFSDFVQSYPDAPLASQAYLYMGNGYQALNKFEQAISSYKSIVDRYPDSQLHPDALFKIGDSLIKLGDVSRGETYFQHVIQKFPDSNAAELARSRLNQ
jgi:tol-pal system protein YbgF